MTCDSARPCSRCVKRSIGHLCHDEHKDDTAAAPAPANVSTPSPIGSDARQQTASPAGPGVANAPVPPTLPVALVPGSVDFTGRLPDPPLRTTSRNGVSSPLGNGGPFMPGYISQEMDPLQAGKLDFNSFTDLNMLYDTSLLGFGNAPYSHFASEHTNNEFLVLSDFLNIMGSPSATRPSSPTATGAASGGGVMAFNGAPQYKPTTDSRMPDLTQEQKQVLARESARYVRNNSAGPRSSSASAAPSRRGSMARPQQPVLSGTTPAATSKPAPTAAQPGGNADGKNGDTPQEKFFLAAADPIPESPEDRLKQVINAKVEAGLMKPFDYVRGYARLQKYMEKNLSAASRQRILAPLSQFRPAFRAIAKRLTDVDLILVEEAFERLLLDYDRVFTSMSVPSCLWRRTGEIFRGNKEFAALIGVDVELLRDGKLAVTELMAEESAVNYWEKYGDIAFDGQQKAVLTSCLLLFQGGPAAAAGGVATLAAGATGASTGSAGNNAANRPRSAASTGTSTPALQSAPNASQAQSPAAAGVNAGSQAIAPTAGTATAAATAGKATATAGAGPTNATPAVVAVVKKPIVSCCFSFTIKRDRYNIPSCIVGNFIPIKGR